ncbi:hypothetical protein GGI42DRAFT_320510 [Trichoderma sp. SZMC 28013]
MGYYSIFLTRAYYCTYIILSFTSITCRLLRAIPRRRGNAAGLPRLRVVSARADPPEPFSRILVQLQSRSSFVAADTCILEPGLNPICHQWTCINHHHGRLCCGIAVFFFLLPLSFRPSPATLLLIPSWFIYSPLGNFPFRRLCSSPMIMMLSRLLTQGDLIRSNATHTNPGFSKASRPTTHGSVVAQLIPTWKREAHVAACTRFGPLSSELSS